MNTAELSKETGVPAKTIRSFAKDLGGIPVGGRHGWAFQSKAPAQLRLLLIARAEKSLRRSPK